jgi:2-iminobutanoate/2-iminopropanoate deaminase
MPEKSVVRTERAPAPFQGAPYSQAIRLGHLVFVSGQLAIDPATGRVTGSTIEEQTERVFQNLQAILEAAGSGLDRLVKTTVFLSTLSHFGGMNDVYRRHVGDRPPARSTVEVGAFPGGALIEIEAIASAPEGDSASVSMPSPESKRRRRSRRANGTKSVRSGSRRRSRR